MKIQKLNSVLAFITSCALLFIFSNSVALFGQSKYDSLQNKSIKAIINSKSLLDNGSQGSIEWPVNSKKYLLKSAGIYLTGISQLADTICSVGYLSGNSDLQPGPLTIGTALPDNKDSWNKIFKVTSDEISYHRNNYSKIGYSPIWAIGNWPVNGKLGYGTILAPFVDVNSNSQYNSLEGDYPYIRGNECAFVIVNDKSTIRSVINGKSGGIEAQVLYYVFKNNDPSFENTLFGKFTLHNRGNQTLKLRFSVFNEFMIGNENDNFIFTDVKNDAMVSYNGTATDLKYGASVPGLAVVMLNNKLSSSIYFKDNNDAVVGYPINSKQVLSYTNGYWKDGKILTFGSAGVDGSNPTKFVYSAGTDPMYPGNDWNEDNAGSLPGKRMGLINSDTFVMPPGSSKIFDIAWMAMPNVNDNIVLMKDNISALKLLYNQGRITRLPKMDWNAFLFYPNPTDRNRKINLNLPHNSGKIKMVIADFGGKIIYQNFVSSKEIVTLDSEIEKGVYLISFTGNKINKTFKIFIE